MEVSGYTGKPQVKTSTREEFADLFLGTEGTSVNPDIKPRIDTGHIAAAATSKAEEKHSQKRLDTDSKVLSKKQNTQEIYHCKTCQKGFASKGGKKFHEKHHHLEAKLFCLKCQKPFKFENDLDRHMKTHSGERPFSCSQCDKTFVCKSSLNQHVRLQHLVGSIYSCSVCNKAFCTLPDLERHYRVHTGIRPFQCDKCSKSFTCRSSLNVHRKTHEGKKFPCSFCKKEFYIKSDLMRHETKHTGNKPWKCDKCSKAYSCKSALKVHQRNSHTGNTSPVSDEFDELTEVLDYSSARRHKLEGEVENMENESSTERDSTSRRPENVNMSSMTRKEQTIKTDVDEDKPLTIMTLSSPHGNRRKPQVVRKIC